MQCTNRATHEPPNPRRDWNGSCCRSSTPLSIKEVLSKILGERYKFLSLRSDSIQFTLNNSIIVSYHEECNLISTFNLVPLEKVLLTFHENGVKMKNTCISASLKRFS